MARRGCKPANRRYHLIGDSAQFLGLCFSIILGRRAGYVSVGILQTSSGAVVYIERT